MKAFRRLFITCGAILAVTALTVTAAFGGHGNGHHQEPGHGRGRSHHIGNVPHYNHDRHYGTDKNIWCDGENSHLLSNNHSGHHGNTVRASLAGNETFVGGFCISSNLKQGDNRLEITYKNNIARHNKVWLRSKDDGAFYPITPDQGTETGTSVIRIQDGGWADRSAAGGTVEAEVLFSGSNSSSNPGNSGGGCNSTGFNFGILALCSPFFLRLFHAPDAEKPI